MHEVLVFRTSHLFEADQFAAALDTQQIRIFEEQMLEATIVAVLSLDDARWAELQHAYGSAADIPSLLEALREMPSSADDAEPWFTLWSSLAHQGDVYSASFAAVPHVIHAMTSQSAVTDPAYFHFPAWVEICRVKNRVPIPEDLERAYFASLAELPRLVASAADRAWDADFAKCALAAVAVAKGQAEVAELILELTQDVVHEVVEWLTER